MTRVSFFILISWTAINTALLIYVLYLFRYFFSVRGRGVRRIIDGVFGKQEKIKKDIDDIKKQLHQHGVKINKSFSKVGLVKFNPFDRVGGEQSHCLAILDESHSGIVITFLYTRDGVRVYFKEVLNGKNKNSEFSNEEKKAIVKAGVV